jgi:hypothetical protein
MSIATLRQEAESASAHRGHVLAWQAPHHGEYRSYQVGVCKTCRAWVSVCDRPLPNEILVGGTAVALSCPVAPVGPDGMSNVWDC